jgi:hypothetical protein
MSTFLVRPEGLATSDERIRSRRRHAWGDVVRRRTSCSTWRTCILCVRFGTDISLPAVYARDRASLLADEPVR